MSESETRRWALGFRLWVTILHKASSTNSLSPNFLSLRSNGTSLNRLIGNRTMNEVPPGPVVQWIECQIPVLKVVGSTPAGVTKSKERSPPTLKLRRTKERSFDFTSSILVPRSFSAGVFYPLPTSPYIMGYRQLLDCTPKSVSKNCHPDTVECSETVEGSAC